MVELKERIEELVSEIKDYWYVNSNMLMAPTRMHFSLSSGSILDFSVDVKLNVPFHARPTVNVDINNPTQKQKETVDFLNYVLNKIKEFTAFPNKTNVDEYKVVE
jgi:hypothetical protein